MYSELDAEAVIEAAGDGVQVPFYAELDIDRRIRFRCG